METCRLFNHINCNRMVSTKKTNLQWNLKTPEQLYYTNYSSQAQRILLNNPVDFVWGITQQYSLCLRRIIFNHRVHVYPSSRWVSSFITDALRCHVFAIGCILKMNTTSCFAEKMQRLMRIFIRGYWLQQYVSVTSEYFLPNTCLVWSPFQTYQYYSEKFTVR